MMHEINEPHIAARKRHVEICENNLCAAVLLNEFIYDFGIESPYSEPDEERAYTHSKLVDNTFDIFSAEEINKALLFLMKKGFINATWSNQKIDGTEDLPFEARWFDVVVFWKEIERACQPYYARVQAQRDREAAEWRARRTAEEANKPPPPPPPTPEELEQRKQEQIFAREAERVQSHIKRALKANLPATLTVEEWIETLDYFEWKCAYCGGDFSLLEHFIPLTHYAGTTKSNCVPACHGCNSVKQSWHPDKIPYSSKKHSKNVQKGIGRVREYLASLGKVNES